MARIGSRADLGGWIKSSRIGILPDLNEAQDGEFETQFRVSLKSSLQPDGVDEPALLVSTRLLYLPFSD